MQLLCKVGFLIYSFATTPFPVLLKIATFVALEIDFKVLLN